MDDSSDEDVTIKRLCCIDANGLVRSVASNDFPIRFTSDSFVAHYIDNVLMIHMNPMFIWRLIFANKNISDPEKEYNFHKLKLFVMRLGSEVYLTKNEVEYKLDNIVYYKLSLRIFEILYTSYSRLYMAIQRGYNEEENVKQFLDSYMILLRYISDS
jgi:hypothetical protein